MKKIALAGVIGSPVSHSKSPNIHAHWLKAAGIKGYYIPVDVLSNDLEKVLKTLPKMGFSGINVTLPHKVRVLEHSDRVSQSAQIIGAANTLTFSESGEMFADNTDGYGFMENLRQNAPDWRPGSEPVVILGAGGAARAIAWSLLTFGADNILIANRTRSRAEALRRKFGNDLHVHDWGEIDDLITEASLLVNTTSLGMHGMPPLPIKHDGLAKNAVVCDIVYAPLQTKLLRNAEKRGCICVDGLGMLLHQAVPAFESWFGVKPVVDDSTRNAALK